MAFSTFIGREHEQAALLDLAGTHRLVTVIGPGGIGKTRLVDEATATLATLVGGNVRRSELANIPPGRDVAVEVAGALGFPSLAALVVALQRVPSLFVLDNCEHLRSDVARLCERLLTDAASLKLVATSREPLGVDGEEVLVLGPLALPGTEVGAEVANAAAMRLFADRARAAGARVHDSAAELAARAELCRRLDGVPLAIELAAARARTLSAGEILGLLDRRFDLLQRDLPIGRSRHRSLRAAIDTSYELLDEEEQSAFRALGAFRGLFSAQLAHEVAAAPGRDLLHTIDVLARLVDRSLLIAEASGGVTRYRMLESLREYAAQQSRIAGEWDACRNRFVDAMVADARRMVVEGVARWSAELLASILLQFDAVVAAIEHVLEVDAHPRRGFCLLLPLWAAAHRGRAAEVAALSQRVLARWPGSGDPLRAEAMAVAATALLAAGQVDVARELATAMLAEPAASALARAIALRALGLLANHGGAWAEAVAHFERGATLAADEGLSAFAHELFVFALSTADSEGDALEVTLARLHELARRAEAAGDGVGLVWAQLVAARHLVRAGRLGEARARLAAANAVQHDFVYPFGAKAGLRIKAVLDTLELGWCSARPSWLAAIDHCAACGDLTEVALTLRDAAELAERSGEREVRELLLDAVPPGVHPVVLGGIFQGSAAAQPPSECGRGGKPHDLGPVREILSAPPDLAGSADHRQRSGGGEVASAPGGSSDLVAGAHDVSPAGLAGSAADADCVWARSGDAWTLRFGGKTTRARHLKGLRDIAVLLARPEQEVHCLELMGGTELEGERGPALDDRARRDYQARVRELQDELDRARADNDGGAVERAEGELDALVSELTRAFGLGGRARPQGSAAERARSAVLWRVRAALKHLREVHPELARHLENAVRTGTWCCYKPEAPIAWRFQEEGAQGRSS